MARALTQNQAAKLVERVVGRLDRRSQVVVCCCGRRKRIPRSYASHVNGCGRKECQREKKSAGRVWTHERILRAICVLAGKLGRTPLYREIEAVVPHGVMQRRFGEVRRALFASGLPMRPRYSGRLTDREWWQKHMGTDTFPPATPVKFTKRTAA